MKACEEAGKQDGLSIRTKGNIKDSKTHLGNVKEAPARVLEMDLHKHSKGANLEKPSKLVP
jgi:hypothetical protein